MKKTFLPFIATLLFTLQLSAQCYPDRHNTTWFDGWISCEKAESPNPDRGLSHWIMYDLAHQYQLGQVHLWNSNDPAHLDRGIKTMIVDYSLDGLTWTELGTYQVEMASGKNIYEGFDGPDFDGIEARYLLITAGESWGDDCVGFSEIRIQVHGVNAVDETLADQLIGVTVFPNPFSSAFKVEIVTDEQDPVYYRLIDVFGRELQGGSIDHPQAVNYLRFDGSDLQNGMYYLIVQQGDYLNRKAVVKVD